MPMVPIIDRLRRAALLRDGGGLSDGQLLGCFVERRDEAAFEALVRRHGPMVLGVCRRVVGNADDAEDAFQATFLVLVRKASSVVPREAVGSWLYGVAYRTALKAQASRARRRAKERQVDPMPQPQVEPAELPSELLAALDRELNRLPEYYRVAVVLCDLEGRPRKEVARRLGLPEGTISSRLAKARKLLAGRLQRYGPALSGKSLAVALAQGAARACVPDPLIVSTTRAGLLVAAGKAVATAVPVPVAALVKGVLKVMLLNKLKIGTAVMLVAAALGLGMGVSAYSSRAAGGDDNLGKEAAPQAPDRPRKVEPPKPDDGRAVSKAELDKVMKLVNKEIENAVRREYDRGYFQGLHDHLQSNCMTCHTKPQPVKVREADKIRIDLDKAVQRLQKVSDRQAELETLEQIEKAVQQRKKSLQQEKDGK